MAKNIQAIIDDLQSGLTELRMHFESLGSIFGGEIASPGGRKARGRPRKMVARAPRVPTGVPPKARKKMTISPALRKQRQMQGQYMGKVRRLPRAQQAKVKKVRETKGYEAALKMMG